MKASFVLVGLIAIFGMAKSQECPSGYVSPHLA